MDEEEVKKEPLPEGFKVRKKDPERDNLPPGFKVRPKKTDQEKINEAAGPLAAEDKTPEEIRKMSVREKMEYAKDLEREREFVQSKQFVGGALSGATFGLSKNVEALKPIEFSEINPYTFFEVGGEVGGSYVPLSKIIHLLSGPTARLASKSPVFQKQISSLLTMFGAGAVTGALESIAQGEMPDAEEVLEHGTKWAILDGILQTAGVVGRFAKGLLGWAKLTGIPRKDLVNRVTQEIEASGIDMNNAEAVSAKALEILEGSVADAEMALGKKLQLPEKQLARETELAQEALKPQEVTSKDLKSRKITDEPVNKLTSETRTLAEPYAPETMNLSKEAESLAENELTSKVESVGTRAASEEELGSNIKTDINARLEALKAEYKPLYEAAEEAAETITHIPQKTAEKAGNKLLRMSKLKTKPAGYQSVIKNFETVLEDAGFVIQRDAEGAIERIVSSKEVPVSDSIELARRLNEMINYEAIEPSVKDAMKSVVGALKQDIRAGLAQNSEALAAFEMAEAEHGRVAKIFTRDTIKGIRGNQAGEKIAKMAESPTALKDLREALSPEQMMQVEREMLEKLNNQNYEKAQKTLRETEKHMSAENRKLARDIVESKNPHNPAVRKKITQDAVLNDVSTALSNGTRPNNTLDLWKTPKGQKIVKETFHNSPNWPEVKTYLEKQSFNDMVSSVLKDGKLDLKKFKSFMRDPAMVNNIRDIGGEEALSFFRKMHYNAQQLEGNVKLLDRLPKKSDLSKGKDILKKTKEQNKIIPKEKVVGEEALKTQRQIAKESKGEKGSRILKRMMEKDFPIQAKAKVWREWLTETMGINEKGMMSVFALMKLGIPNTVVTMLGYRVFNKMLVSPRVRKAFMEASKYQHDPIRFMIAIENFGDAMEED